MADNKFKVGDVVRLKSGGPLMTVSEVGTGDKGCCVSLKWFVKSNELSDALIGANYVHQDTLELVPTVQRA